MAFLNELLNINFILKIKNLLFKYFLNIVKIKENEKEKAMIEVDNFYQNMDIVLSQYESMSDSILSTYDCKINK